MAYIDGFVAAVPTANKDEYIAHARKAALAFRRLGALSAVEGWGDDVPKGETTSFDMAVRKEENETVIFSWITWPDKATRDAGMKAMMDEPDMDPANNPMPFDGKRMIYGGFQMVVEE